MEKIKIEGLYEAAKAAYYHLSFDPEKRAERIVAENEAQLNDDLETIPEEERERYIEGYKKHLFAWLSAKSRTLSPMITGPANFPVSKNRTAMQSEMNRLNELVEWRKKVLSSIEKKVEASKPIEQKNAEALEDWKRQVDRLFEGYLVNRFKSRLETVARTGNVELVAATLDYMKDQQSAKCVTLATPRNSLWSLPEVAEKFRASLESVKTVESTEEMINGVRIVKNSQADRLQLFFDGKPEQSMITSLKQAAFRWSPSNGCWQRQLTQNAVWAAQRLLKL